MAGEGDDLGGGGDDVASRSAAPVNIVGLESHVRQVDIESGGDTTGGEVVEDDVRGLVGAGAREAYRVGDIETVRLRGSARRSRRRLVVPTLRVPVSEDW